MYSNLKILASIIFVITSFTTQKANSQVLNPHPIDYNFKGKVLKVKQINSNSSNHNFAVFVYKNEGNIDKSHIINKYNKKEFEIEYSYNNKPNLKEINIFLNDELLGKFELKNENGRIIERNEYDKNAKIKDKIIWLYNNSIKSPSTISSNSDFNITLLANFSNGFFNEKLIKYSNDFYVYTTYERNNDGYIIKQKNEYLDENPEEYSFKYEYDTKGNWIKQFQYVHDGTETKLYGEISRSIIYFNESTELNPEEEFLGVWVYGAKNRLIEFRKDKELKIDYKGEGTGTLGIWEIDPEQEILTIKASNGDELIQYKYSFKLEGFGLELLDIKSRRKVLFIKN